jgi:DNA recombination protein Rad52
MSFSDVQVKLLTTKLNEKHVRTRIHQGKTLSYIEAWHVIAEANRIFGFDGWDRETIVTECVWQDGKRDPKTCAYAARVRIKVRAGETTICREGSGMGHGSGATLAEAHESALKEAETDAMKRALATFGNQFGLALYDKDQSGVRRRPERSSLAVGITWTLLSGAGARLSRHELPEDFCSAFRQLIETTPRGETLRRIWSRNARTVEHLRRAWPELKTINDTHYSDVLQKLYEQALERLRSTVTSAAGAEEDQPVRQSELSLGLARPKRLRDPDHLRYVASLPCLVCARVPSHAHHLRFAQVRALASKVSDEWTVPLCFTHHRALHDAGQEELWWQVHAIDAKAEAERLWLASHAPRIDREVGSPVPHEVANGSTVNAPGGAEIGSKPGNSPEKSAAE